MQQGTDNKQMLKRVKDGQNLQILYADVWVKNGRANNNCPLSLIDC